MTLVLRRAIVLIGLAILAACAQPDRLSIPPDTTLIILRHADRDGDQLSNLGRARSAALPAALAAYDIDKIYSTGIDRNLDTAAPLAAATGLEVQAIAGAAAPAALLDGNAGLTVVWVGNKGNLQQIWDIYNAPPPAPLEYGDLYVLERGAFGRPMVTRMRFEPAGG